MMPQWFINLGIICLTMLMIGFLFVSFSIIVCVGYALIKEWFDKKGGGRHGAV